MKAKNKNVVIVLEGVGRVLLQRWIDLGHFRSLAGLLKRAGGSLCSTLVPYEAQAHQTAFTGYDCGDHGVFSYWKVHDPDYQPKIWNSDELPRRYFWEWDEFRPIRSAILNIFGTQPVRPMNGYLLAYLFQQSIHCTHPPGLLRELQRDGHRYSNDVSVLYTAGSRDDLLAKLFRIERNRIATVKYLLPKVDFLLVDLTLMDRLSHFYWQEIEEGSPFELPQTALYQALQILEEGVMSVIDQLDLSSSRILLYSNVGFGPMRGFVSVNAYLHRTGFLHYQPDGKIDYEKTVAFESIQGSHGVNLNTRRYHRGIVTDDRVEQVEGEVADSLRQFVNPLTGLPMFRWVKPSREVYAGSHVGGAPDLTVMPFDERYPPMGCPEWANYLTRYYQSGWHRRECFWTGVGEGFGRDPAEATLFDILPTIFAMNGLNPPARCRGRSLLETPVRHFAGPMLSPPLPQESLTTNPP